MDRTRERGIDPDVSGLSERDLAEAITKGNISKEHLQILTPFFDALREKIFTNWRAASVKDVDSLRGLKHQLWAVDHLQGLMGLDVTRGKNATKKLEAK